MNTNNQQKDGRGYFRIVDFIGFDYRLITDAEFARLRVASKLAEVPPLDELAVLDQQIQLVIDRLNIKQPDASALGALLNKKLDLILRHSNLASDLPDLNLFPQRQVDISATGIAFPTKAPLSIGQNLHLDLLLQSGRQHLKLLAKVVGCDNDASSLRGEDPSLSHIVRVNFIEMSEHISEFLIQYLVKRQGAILKSRRLEKE
jgi:hypothetical protein